MADEFTADGKAALYEAIQPWLLGTESLSLQKDLARQLGLSPTALRSTLSPARDRLALRNQAWSIQQTDFKKLYPSLAVQKITFLQDDEIWELLQWTDFHETGKQEELLDAYLILDQEYQQNAPEPSAKDVIEQLAERAGTDWFEKSVRQFHNARQEFIKKQAWWQE